MLGLIAAVILAAAAPETSPSEAAGPPAPAKAAEAGEEPPSAASEKKKASGDERVCWDRTPVGTRFSERVCATRRDLDDRRQRDQNMMRTVRTAPTPNN